MTDVDLIHFLARPSDIGKREASLRAALDSAEQLGFRTSVLSAPTPEGVADAIANAPSPVRRLVIVGGDGLIHRALPALVDSEIAVGIVPSGTGNDFARGLGIGTGVGRPSAKQRSIHRRAILGEPVPVDVIASTDGRYAASVVTAGFSGRVNARANPMRFPPGQLKYTMASVVEAARLELIGLRLRTPDGEFEFDSAFFAVGNTRFFGGGMAICPDAVADDGQLAITVVGAASAAKLLAVMPSVFVGRHVKHPDVTTIEAPWVEIEIDSDEPLWADGEPFGQAPVRLEARPAALSVAHPTS